MPHGVTWMDGRMHGALPTPFPPPSKDSVLSLPMGLHLRDLLLTLRVPTLCCHPEPELPRVEGLPESESVLELWTEAHEIENE